MGVIIGIGLGVLVTIAYHRYGAQSTSWLSSGGDFALHRGLIEYLHLHNYGLGPQGTPLTWHYLVSVFGGENQASMFVFSLYALATFSWFVVTMFECIPTSGGRVARIARVCFVITLVFSSILFRFPNSGFVTLTASGAFVLVTFKLLILESPPTTTSLALGSMSAFLAVAIWQPAIIPIGVICVSSVFNLRELLIPLRSLLRILLIPTLCAVLIIDILRLTVDAQATAGGIAPKVSVKLVLILGILLCIAIPSTFQGRQRLSILAMLCTGTLLSAIYWILHRMQPLDYFGKKVIWIFIAIEISLAVTVVSQMFSVSHKRGLVSLVAFVGLFWLVGHGLNWRASETMFADMLHPHPPYGPIFDALDKIDRNNDAGAFFIESGDDYEANLWVQFGLYLPAGPVDPTGELHADIASMCDFTRTYPTAPIYTANVPKITKALQMECHNSMTSVRALHHIG